MEIDPSPIDDDYDVVERFRGMSARRRGAVINNAARAIIDPQTLETERKTRTRQIQAALEVDPNLVVDILAATCGEDLSGEFEKLKRDAVLAQANFNGLVTATQTLRASLTEMGIVREGERLPETVEQWKLAIGGVVDSETQRLAVMAQQVLGQQGEMEARRVEILAEIGAAQALLRQNAPTLDGTKLALGQIGGQVTDLLQAEVTKIVAGVIPGIEELLKRSIENLITLTEGKVAKATAAMPIYYWGAGTQYETGQKVEGKGIYLGFWAPRDSEGKSINRRFDVFVAPGDLTGFSSEKRTYARFKSTALSVASKVNWHGHNGFPISEYAIDKGYEAFLIDALKKDTYNGGWIIPPLEILYGMDARENRVVVENMFGNQSIGKFAHTYIVGGQGHIFTYWSSTEPPDGNDSVFTVNFRSNKLHTENKNYDQKYCRPCRLELIL